MTQPMTMHRHRWFHLFQNFLHPCGDDKWSATRRRALLLHYLRPESQRLFDALPAPAPRQSPLSSGPTDTTLTEGAKVGTQLTADATVASPPDLYNVAFDTLARRFTATTSVGVERHHFRDAAR
ncbi:hypothetical protein HPB52_005401 [Rhipicephalus sanguineus]|uniref:Uncharacterized protein n=1 Tax=Rhipicephalus sanguineus TaxID=34632 RepID=A0A9D4PYM7_RHISA|nr:hypothetical protein HPB52_005401 [Rhipicephalus sanguineus]